MKFATSLFLLALYLLLAPTVKATEHIDETIDANPIQRTPARYPSEQARLSQEGWVKLSYVIDKNGNVIDPIIENSSGIRGFEKSAIKAVKKWTYSPAKRNGKVIEQCRTSVQLDFILSEYDDEKPRVTDSFARLYKKIRTAIKKKDFLYAEEKLSSLRNGMVWNMAENAWFFMLDSVYAKEIEDKSRELSSLVKAVSVNRSEEALGNENYLNLLSRLFIIEVQQNLFAESLETFEMIRETKNNQKTVSRLEGIAKKIDNAIHGDDFLIRQAVIHSNSLWRHKLTRNSFAVENLDGILDNVEIRCDNHRSRYNFENNTQWDIPNGWGQCILFVQGEKDAKFTLIELPILPSTS